MSFYVTKQDDTSSYIKRMIKKIKIMKTILHTISIILLAILMQSCSFNTIRGNGVITEEIIPISDYNTIDFRGGANLVYEQKTDAAPYLRIEIDENLYPLLTIDSNNEILTLGRKENISPTKYAIYTNSTSLEKLITNGSIKAHLKGKITGGDIEFKVAGSGNITCDDIECNSITSRVSGSGDIILVGKTGKIDSSISGSGKVEASAMSADTVFCSISDRKSVV